MVLVNDLAWKDDESLEEHQKMKDMPTIKFWQDLKEPSAYKDLYQIAIVVFPLYGRILKNQVVKAVTYWLAKQLS